jgi:hypothetical protein
MLWLIGLGIVVSLAVLTAVRVVPEFLRGRSRTGS